MIFERHFEEKKEEEEKKKGEDMGSIDAEPYKFLGGDSPNNNEDFFPSLQIQLPQTQEKMPILKGEDLVTSQDIKSGEIKEVPK